MNTTTQTQSKWYDNTLVIVLLLFFFPPVGVYGMFKRNSDAWKKVVYLFAGLGIFLFQILFVVGLIATLNTDYYQKGKEFYANGNKEEALENLQSVSPFSDNYKKAQELISQIREEAEEDKQREIKYEEEQKVLAQKEIEKKFNALKEFQKEWADSVVKSNNGWFILNSKLSLPDTIYFELSKNATKSYNSNKREYLPFLISTYNKSLKNKFNTSSYDSIETIIDFLPNQELAKENNSEEWTHPTLLNKGLKVYKGNQYSKTYLGELWCKYKDENRSYLDGNQFVRVKKSDGSMVNILRYDFQNSYWIKYTDPNYNSAVGISECN